jgi:hypothetical protein
MLKIEIGLFIYGLVTLFAISAALAALDARLSRSVVRVRMSMALVLCCGTGALALAQHLTRLSVGVVGAADAAAVFLVAIVFGVSRQIASKKRYTKDS